MAERAKGGAGLVVTEMTCVSPEGRITPGCTGLYAPEHEAAWKRIVDFVHAETDAKIAMQLGHSGPKGSTQLGWEDDGRAAAEAATGRIMAPSPVAWSPHNQVPREMTPRRHGQRCGSTSCARRRWPRAPASTCSSCTARTAICCRRSSRRSPTAAPTPTAGRSRTACAFRSRCSTPCARSGRSTSRSRCASPPTTGSATTASRRRTPSPSRACCKAAGVDIIDVSAGQTSIEAQPGLRPHVPDAVLRSHPQRDRHRHHGRRQHLRARPRQLDPDGGTRRPVLPGAAASRRPVLDAARRGTPGLYRRGVAQAVSRRARSAVPAGGTQPMPGAEQV